MGYTKFTKDKIEKYIKKHFCVIDLGAQNDFSQEGNPFISDWYDKKRLEYRCIDLNGENGAWKDDLSVIYGYMPIYDLVTDCGTSEHVGDNGKFGWEAIYNCWRNKHDLLIKGGIMYNENPKTGSWPLHGFQWYTQEFYKNLVKVADYKILELGEVAAMGNTKDGWNVYCILKKTGDKFPTLEQFKELGLKQS